MFSFSNLAMGAALALGASIGLGLYTFHYAKGTSYLSNDPTSCVNCHVMQEHFDAWQKGSHHAVATCVQCHLPKEGFSKWLAKIENGYHHSKAFTLQNFHEPIRMKEKNLAILEANCISCHTNIVGNIVGSHKGMDGSISCVKCHSQVGHAEWRSGGMR